jgi:hypothetical protein
LVEVFFQIIFAYSLRTAEGLSPDVDALTNAQLDLLTQDEMRRRLGEAGRRRVIEAFSSERMAHETDLLYKKALARPVEVESLPHVRIIDSVSSVSTRRGGPSVAA